MFWSALFQSFVADHTHNSAGSLKNFTLCFSQAILRLFKSWHAELP